MINWLKRIFKRKQKHKFDLDNSILAEVDGFMRNSDRKMYNIFVNGYKCEKCGEILYLDRWQIEDLPKTMRYCGASDTKVLEDGTRTEA